MGRVRGRDTRSKQSGKPCDSGILLDRPSCFAGRVSGSENHPLAHRKLLACALDELFDDSDIDVLYQAKDAIHRDLHLSL